MRAAPSVPPFVDVQSHRHAGYVTACGLLILQRRAFTPHREACPGGRGSVRISALETGIQVQFDDDRGTRTQRVATHAEADAVAARYAGELLGLSLRPAPFLAAYMYEPRPRVGGSDRIVSPLRYQPGSDTLRTAQNVCVASFPDGTFASARICDDPAGRAAWPHVEQALARGFHAADHRTAMTTASGVSPGSQAPPGWAAGSLCAAWCCRAR